MCRVVSGSIYVPVTVTFMACSSRPSVLAVATKPVRLDFRDGRIILTRENHVTTFSLITRWNTLRYVCSWCLGVWHLCICSTKKQTRIHIFTTLHLDVLTELNVKQSADFEIRFFLCVLCRALMTIFPTSHLIVDVFGIMRSSKNPHKSKCPNHVNTHHKTSSRLLTSCIKDILSKFFIWFQLPGSFLPLTVWSPGQLIHNWGLKNPQEWERRHSSVKAKT